MQKNKRQKNLKKPLKRPKKRRINLTVCKWNSILAEDM
jgi:hypothetical protein